MADGVERNTFGFEAINNLSAERGQLKFDKNYSFVTRETMHVEMSF